MRFKFLDTLTDWINNLTLKINNWGMGKAINRINKRKKN